MTFSETAVAWVSIFVDEVSKNLSDLSFWAGDVLSWLIFSVVLVALLNYMQRRRESIASEPLRGWTLRVIGFGNQAEGWAEVVPIYEDDVRRFLNSDFEMVKFIKSVCSGTAQVKVRTRHDVLDGWTTIDRERRKIEVDFIRLPDRLVDRWVGERPPGREASRDHAGLKAVAE